MAALDARAEDRLAEFAGGVRAALGERLLCLAVYGSAAGPDWVAGRSDVNTAVVVGRVTLDVLEALAPVVATRDPVLALPLILDTEYLQRARDTFPMELADLRAQHRVLAGTDLFAAVETDPAALRRECEREARGKLLRLRTVFLATAGDPVGLERVMVESLKSFLVLLRHLLALRGAAATYDYAAVLAAGEAALGPLPGMHRVLAHRTGTPRLAPAALRAAFADYLADVERVAGALDRLDA